MDLSFIMILEAVMLASALSLDAFITSFAYGSKKIKIPFKSVQVINLICSSITGLSLFAGTIIRQYISDRLTIAISFTILFVLGMVKILDSITKAIIRKHNSLNKEISFSLFNLKFILNLYANPEDADIDKSKTLSPIEAVSLAIALSLDGITVGLGAALGNANGPAVFLCSLITDMAAIILGCFVGNKIANTTPFNLSWLSGLILVLLAFSKLF